MKQIVLLCANGMSTSMLVRKMRDAAKEDAFECTIDAHPIDDARDFTDADIILLGPQVQFQLNKVRSIVNCPVEVIEMLAYGTMNGKAVLDFVKQRLGD